MTNDGEKCITEDDPTVQIGIPHKELSPAIVNFLDGRKKTFYIHKNSDGDVLINMVGNYLQLQERDYFGLTYYDKHGNKNWVYSDRCISKKLKNLLWEFYFEVKFYPQEPSQLADDFTRYLLCLQLRQDIYTKRLPLTFATKALLASYVVQELRGDYHEHPPLLDYSTFLSEAKTSDSITAEFVEKVKDLHKQHKGLTPGEAESAYLEVAKKLNMYGIFTFPARDNNNPVVIGISAPGISVFSDQVRIHRFLWNHIIKFAYRKNVFSVKLKPNKAINGKKTFTYKMDDNGSAKRTWRCGVEHHTFFRLIQPEDDLKSNVICAPRGNRIFHYHGRTQYQTKLHATMFDHVSSDIDRSDSIRVDKNEVCYIIPVEVLDEKNRVDSRIEDPVSEINLVHENYLTPSKDARISSKDQFTKDTFNSSGYGSAPSSSRVRFADRLPLKLEGKKVRKNLFGKGKEDDIEKQGFIPIGGTYPKDNEEIKTDIVLTNEEMSEIPIDYMVSVYHSGQSINDMKRKHVCCGAISNRSNKKNNIKKDDISEPITLTEDVEKYPLRYKVDVYHSGKKNAQKYGINRNKKNFKRLTHEGVTDVVKRDKVDLTFYPHDTTEHPVKERLKKHNELECEPLRKFASKYHSGLSVMSKKEAKEQRKIVKRDRLLTHESTPSKTTKSKCIKCNCIGSQPSNDRKRKTKFEDNDVYDLSTEPYEGPLSIECKKEEFKGAPLSSVCAPYEIPKYRPSNKKNSSALTCIKPQKRAKKDDEYTINDNYPKIKEEYHVVKKKLKEEEYPGVEIKKKTEFIEKIEERPIIEYDVAKSVIDTEKDWSLKVSDGRESGIKKSTQISKTLLPQRMSTPHSSKDNIYGLCCDAYDGPLETVEKKNELDSNPIDNYVHAYQIPQYTTKKSKRRNNRRSVTSEDQDLEQKNDIPSSSNEIEIRNETNIYNLNVEPYKGKLEVVNKSSDLEKIPINKHAQYYDIPEYLPRDEKRYEVKETQPSSHKIVRETIILTQKAESEKPTTVLSKEVAFANENLDNSTKKEKTNSLTRFIGRFNKKDNDVGKKKQGTILSDQDSGVDDILSGTEAGTLTRKDNQKEIKKDQKRKKSNLLCSSTGKKGSMAYLPIQQIHHSSIDKGYPMKEEPYVGELESFSKNSELPSESLRNSVQVYHSGLSDSKPSWNKRFIIFSRTKHEGVEEIIEKNEINKDPYQLLSTQPFDGPLEKLTHDNEISTEPIKHYSKVYHHGQSTLTGGNKKGKSKKNNKKRDSLLIDSEEEDYQPKDKTSSLSRFMGFFNRRGGRSNNEDAVNDGLTTENDSGMDASNSSAEVPTKYSLERYDKKNKNKTSKYIINTEPYLGTYDNTIRVNELQMEPLKDSVNVYHSGQSVSTIKHKKHILSDQTTESDTDDEKRNGRSNTLTRIIGKFHMPKKSNGTNTLDGGYPRISGKYEGEYETINRIDEVKKIPLTQEVQLYDIPKYHAKIEKKNNEPSCSYCTPVGRRQSSNVYDKTEDMTNEEDAHLNLHKDQDKSQIDKIKKSNIESDMLGGENESKTLNKDDYTVTVMVPEHMIEEDFNISIPEDALEKYQTDKNIKAHILINKDSNLKVKKKKKNNISCYGKSKDKPINLDIYPKEVKYEGPIYDIKSCQSLPKTKLEEFVDVYPIPKYKNKADSNKKNKTLVCFKKNDTDNKIETKDNDLYVGKISYEKPEIESQIKYKTDIDVESRKPELEAFYEIPTKEKEIKTHVQNIELPKSEVKVEKHAIKEPKLSSLDCAGELPDLKLNITNETLQKETNTSNEYLKNNEFEDINMKMSVPETLSSGNVQISVPDISLNDTERDIKAHIVIDEPEIIENTTTFESKSENLPSLSYSSENNDEKNTSVKFQYNIQPIKNEIQLDTTTFKVKTETKKTKLKEPKRGQLNYDTKISEFEIESSYEVPPKKAELYFDAPEVKIEREVKREISVPTGKINLEYPEIKMETSDIKVEKIKINKEDFGLHIDTHVQKPKTPKCGQFNCAKKSPEAEIDASYKFSPKKIDIPLESPKINLEEDVEIKVLVPEHLAEEDIKISIPETSMDLQGPDVKARIMIDDSKIKLPEVKYKSKQNKLSCLSCIGKKKNKFPTNFEAYPPQITYDGPVNELKSEPTMTTVKLDQHVNLYPIPKYSVNTKKSRKCSSLNCVGKKPGMHHEIAYSKPDIKSPEGEITTDIEQPSGHVEIPQLTAEAKIDKPEIKVRKPKAKEPTCASLNCFAKKTRHEIDASYEIPSKKIDVQVESPQINLDIEQPSGRVEVPQITAEAKIDKPEIKVKKPRVKGPKCAPLNCFAKKPKHDIKASYEIPSKKIDVKVETPEVNLDIEQPSASIEIPELTAEAKIDKPEITVKKPKVKGPKCAPLSCFGRKPKHDIEASYEIPSKKIDVKVETPDVNLDIEQPSGSIEIPELTAEAKIDKPEITVKKPKVKGPKCAPLSCFAKKPKHDIEASYEIPSKKIDVKVETPDVNLDIEQPSASIEVPELTAEAKINKPEITVKKPKVKGPKCAPLSCFGRKPKHDIDVSYEIPSKKIDVKVETPDVNLDIEQPSASVEVPQLTAEAKIGKPEITVKKPKVKGPKCAPLSCFGRKPKHDIDVSYEIPSKKIDVKVGSPDVNLDIEQPSASVEVPQITAEAKIDKPEITVKKPKIKGPKCAPLNCFAKKPKHDIDVSYEIPSKKIEVQVESPDVNLDIEQPSASIEVPELTAEAKIGKPEIEVKKPKVKRPKCAPLSCFGRKPRHDIDVSYEIPSKKIDVQVESPDVNLDIEQPSTSIEVPQITAEAKIGKPEITVKKPKVKGPKCAPLSCFGIKPKHDIEASYEIPSKKIDVKVETPDVNLDIEQPSASVEVPHLTAEAKIGKPEVEVKKPKVKGLKCAPLNCFAKKPKHDIDVSYEIPSKKIDVKVESPDVNLDVEQPSTSVEVPQLTAEAKIDKPEITVKKPKVKGPKCAPLNCFAKKPKHDIEASYEIPSKKIDVKVETPEVNLDIEQPSAGIEVPELTAEAKFGKPEITVKKPKVKGPKCAPLNCFAKKPKHDIDVSYEIPSKKIEVQVESPDVNLDIEQPSASVEVPQLTVEAKIDKPEIKVKKPKVKGPKCAPLSCFGRKPKHDIEASYEIPSKKIDVQVETPDVNLDIEQPSGSIEVPELTAEAKIGKPEIEVKKPKVKGPKCAPLNCFAKKPKHDIDVSYELPSKKIDVKVETPDVNLDIEQPSASIEVPQLTAEAKIDKPEITVKKPKVKGPKCAPSSCFGRKPKHDIEASYEIPSKKIDVKVETPDVNLDIEQPSASIEVPQLTAEAKIDKPEIEVKKPKVKGPKCAPLNCFAKKPKHDIEASYKIPSKKIDVEVETPEVNLDIEQPSASIEVPELTAEAKFGKPEIEVKKPKVKGPKCAPLNCFAKKPKHDIDVSYEIPSKKIDVQVETPDVNLDIEQPSASVEVPQIIAEAKIDKPEITVKKPKVKGPKCAPLSCFGRKPKHDIDVSYEIPSKKINMNVESPDVNLDIEQPSASIEVPELTAEAKIDKPEITVKKPKVKGPKCAPLNCFGRKPRHDIDVSYEIPSKKIDVQVESPDVNLDIEQPSASVEVPQLTAEAKIGKPEIEVKKPKVKGPKCAPLNCFAKKPKHDIDVSYEIPSKKIDVQVESPDVNLDIEQPSASVEVPQLTAEAKIGKPEIEVKKPKVKGPKCVPLNCFAKKPKHDIDLSYEIPSKKIDIHVESPDVNLDIEQPSASVEVPQITAEAKIDKPEITVKKPKVKGPKCAPLSCFGRKPKHDIDVSYEIPSKKIDVKVETPDVNLDIKQPSASVEVPQLTAEAKIGKPEITVKKPKVKGPKCAPLSCFGRKPKHDIDVSYEIPSKKIDVKVGSPDVNLDIEQPSASVEVPQITAEAKIDKPEITVKNPKVKGPKCAPLSCFGRKPKHDIDVSYEIPSKKIDVKVETPDVNLDIEQPSASVEVPQLTAEAKIDKPEIEVKKPKVKGPKCAPLSCFGRKPKHDIEASYEIPSKKIDVQVESPDVNLDIERPSASVEVPQLTAEAKIDKPEITVKKPKVKGPKCVPLNCFAKKPKHDIEASYEIPSKKIDVKVETPDVNLDIEQPSASIEVPQLTAEAKIDKPEIEVKKPKVKGPKCAPLSCFGRKPKHDIEASYEIPSKKIDVKVETPEVNLDIEQPSASVEVPQITAEAKIDKPEIEVMKPKVKGPKCAPLNCFAKKPKHDIDVSYEIPSKKIDVKVETPDVNLDIEQPSASIEVPELTAEAKIGKPEIEVKKPKVKGPKCAPLTCFAKEPKYDIDASYKIPSKKIDVQVESPDINIDVEQPSANIEVPHLTAEAKLGRPAIDVDKPKVKGPKCAPLNCYTKKPKYDIDASYEIPTKTFDYQLESPDVNIDIKEPTLSVEIPELVTEVKTIKPEIDLTKPNANFDASFEVPSNNIDLHVESPEVKLDIQQPTFSANIPELHVETNLDKPEIEVKKPKFKGPACGQFNCAKKSPEIEIDASYKLSPKKIDIPLESPKINLDEDVKIKVLVPEHLAEEDIRISIPETSMDLQGPDVKARIMIDDSKITLPEVKYKSKQNKFSCLSCIGKKKTKLPTNFEAYPPQITYDGPVNELKSEPTMTTVKLDQHVALYPIPKYNVSTKKNRKCSSLNCVGKKPGMHHEVAYSKPDIKSVEGEITTDIEQPSASIEVPQLTAEARIDKPEIEVKKPRAKGPKCAPLSCFGRKPKHEIDASYEIPPKKIDVKVESPDVNINIEQPSSVSIDVPQLTTEAKIDKPEIEVKKPKIKGQKCAPLNCFGRKPKHDIEASYEIPSKKIDVQVESPEVKLDIQQPTFSADSLELKEDADLEKIDINTKKIKLKGPKFGHFNLTKKSPKGELDTSYELSSKEGNILLESPNVNLENDVKIKVLVPEHLAEEDLRISIPETSMNLQEEDIKAHIIINDKKISSSEVYHKPKNIGFSCFSCIGGNKRNVPVNFDAYPPQITYDGPVNELKLEPLMKTTKLDQHVNLYQIPKYKVMKNKPLIKEKDNNKLDILEFQRVTDTSKNLTSMFTTTDPLSGDLNSHLTISLHQKMDCECKVIFCRTDNEEVGACCRSCAYSKCYQTLSANINMNNIVKGVPEITILQPSKPSLLSILKKPFKGNSKNEKDENYKKISKKNKSFHYSSDSSFNSPDIKEKEEEKESDIIDAVMPTNDQSKLNSQNSAANMVLNNPNNVSLNKPSMNSNTTGIPQNNMRSSVLNGTVSLQQSSGPYRKAEPLDGEVIREERIEHVYKLRGTGNAPTLDPSDMSLSATLAKCVEENSSLPRVTMVCKDVHVKDYGVLEPYITEESNLPHTTIQSWQETDVGPDTIYTETDPSGKVTKKTIKTQQTKHTIQKQSYQTFNVDDNTLPPKNTTIDKTVKVTTPRISSGTKGPVVETRTRTVAYECHPEEALVTKDGDVPGEFVSSKTVTTGNKTIETITYKTEKDGIVETRVEHKVTIHSDDNVDHDAELSQALLDVTSMDPDMAIEKIEVKQETQN
uniref:Cytochrome b561 domain-containing protein n=1 Tax=Strongyloides stercoralis TaxID=6248 RepID=A0AAF5CSI3_STRER